MAMKRYTYDYNGKRYTIDAPEGSTAADLQRIVTGGQQKPKPREDRNYVADLYRAGVRGVGSFIEKGIPALIERAPDIIAKGARDVALTQPGLPGLFAPALEFAPKIIAPQYRETMAPTIETVRKAGEDVRTSVAPRQRGNVYEEYERGGVLGGLASLGETVAESSPGTLAALGTALVTRNPRAAAAVMGATSAPQTFASIMETQKREGIDDIDRAIAGTVVSTALDMFTGVGGAIRSLAGRQAAEELLKRGLFAAAQRVAGTGVKEGGTEILQNIIEQVAGGADPTTKEAVLNTLEAGMAGMLGGAVFGGATEAAGAVIRPKEEDKPTPEAAPEAAPEIDADLQKRTTAYLNVGYPQQYAEEMALADRLREAEEQRRAVEAQTKAAPAPGVAEAVEEPRRALRPLTNKQVKEARDWVRADMMTFPEELVRQPTDEELDLAARELAQDPAISPMDMLNAVMERNDARGVAPEAAPVAAPEPMGEAPGTFRTEYNINGETQVVEGPTTPAADQTVEGVATPVAPEPVAAPTPLEDKIAAKRQQLAEQQAADDAEIAKIEQRKGEPSPYDIIWKEAKQKYPGVMNPQAIDLMQGFGAVSPEYPEVAPPPVNELLAKGPEGLATYVEGMQRGFELHGIPVKLPPVPTDLDPNSREYRKAVGDIEIAAKAGAIQGLQQRTGGAPLTVAKGTRVERRGVDGTAHIVELNDGTVVEMFRDTDQFGTSNPVWYVQDPLSTQLKGWEGVDSGLGSTKKEALERVAARVERGRQNTLDAAAPPAPEPVVEPEPKPVNVKKLKRKAPKVPETAPEAPAQRTVIVVHGGSDFENIDPAKFGTGEPGGIRPLGNGLYGYVVDSTNPDEIAKAVDSARRYAEKYGRGKKAIHAFQLDLEGARTGFNGPIIEGLEGVVDPEEQAVMDTYRRANALPVGPERSAAFDEAWRLEKEYPTPTPAARFERLPVGLTEVGVNDTGRLKRIGKISTEQSDQELIDVIQNALGVAPKPETAPESEEQPEFIPNPLPHDVNAWAALHVGKTQKENAKLVERRKKAERAAVEMELPIASLIGTEDQIGRRALENPSTELPYVEKANGKYYIVDGNHRVVAEYLKGATTVRALVGDLDAATVTEPEVVPEQPAPSTTPEQQANGELVAQQFTDGVVAYQNGDIGLVRAYKKDTGKPLYIPFKGTQYVNTDVSGLKNELKSLSTAEKAELVKAKEDMEAAAAAEHAANPSVTYGENNLAFSESVPEALRGVVTGWKGMLLDPEAKLFVITAEDAQARKGTFTGPHRAVDYATTQKEEAGRAVKVGPNEFFIVYEANTKPTKVLETVAHELGHIHQWESFNNAPPATQKALREEHFKWVKQQKGKTARALVESLRGRTMGRQVEVSEDLSADQLSTYWTSFSEWYADQTARWAVSNEKPVTVVEKFFARLGKALRNFYQSLRAQRYLPTETFSKYMAESSRNLDVAPELETELTYDDVLNEITGAYEGDPTEGIEPQISRQAYNLLKQAAENQKASPEELMDKLREAMDKYAGEDYAAPAKRKVKTAEEVAEAIAEADRKIKEKMAGYRAQLGTTQSLEGSGLMDPLAEAYDAHDIKDKSGFIRNAFDNFFRNADYANLRVQLLRLPTRDLVLDAERISNRQEGEGKAPIREAYDIQDRAQGLRSTLLNAGGRLQEDVDSFIGDKGLRKYADAKQRQSALFFMLDFARALAFNPTAHAGLNDALVNDSVIKIAKDRLANAKREQERGKARNQIKEREDMIRRAWMYWQKLGEYSGGHETFTKIVDYYATLTRATRNEIDGLVRAMRSAIGDENADAILEIIREADASFDEVPKEALKGDIFDDIPTRAFPVVYVPWNRFGKYVLQIKPGTKGYPIGYRGQFDTLTEREDEAKRIAGKLGIDPNDAAVFDRHSDPNRAAQENATESTVIRNVLKVVRNAELNVSPATVMDETSRDAAAQALKADLERQLTELLLTALPEESIRKQFIKAKGIPGRSGDHTRVLAYNIQRYANQLPRLKFGYELNSKLEEAQQEFADAEDSRAKEMAEILLDEIGGRLQRGLNPPDNNPLISAFNSFGYTMLLSAPASAINNATVTWQRAAFELSTEYGPKAATTLARLEGVMRLMGKVHDDPTGNIRKFYAPSVLKLPLIYNNPTYRKAFLALRDVYNAFGHGMVQDIIMQGRASSTRPRGVRGHVMDYIQKITGIINAPFGVVERITNEKIGMATFMLEYEKLKAAGKTETEAFDGAVDKARLVMKDTVGAYGEAERPPIFRGPGALLLLFKSFSLNIGAFIERQYSKLLYQPMAAVGDLARGRMPKKRSVFTPAEKRQATKTLMALYAGNFLWTGVSGLFGFSVMAKMLAPFIFMFMDDDEREEWARENPEYVNNMPGYIIEQFIPQTFGGYSDIIAYGPVSALTGINLSARIGYDNLFFKDPVMKTGNTWNDTKAWFMDNFAAGVGRADEFMKGANFLMEGNTEQAVKRMIPAAFGAPVKAITAFDEGVKDARGREIIRKGEITLPMAAKMAFGYQPIEVSKSYSRLYGSMEQLGAIKQEGRKLLRALNDARAKGDYDRVIEVEEQIEDFNTLYPGSEITSETIKRSQSAYESREKRLYRGVELKGEERERIESDIEAFWSEEE